MNIFSALFWIIFCSTVAYICGLLVGFSEGVNDEIKRRKDMENSKEAES